MRVYVTGATGFVGRWLTVELANHGHSVVAAPSSSVLPLSNGPAWAREIEAARPDAIIHLAAIARAAQARTDPVAAIETNVGGTWTVVDAAAALEPRPAFLLVSSAEVYGEVHPPTLLDESGPLRPRQVYGSSKLAQEAVALWAAVQQGMRVVVVRPFNHTGPGQRDDFVVPALVKRVLAVRSGNADEVAVGNLDVDRDIGDVRDVVRAYRLLVEALAEGGPGPGVFNVATGRPVSLREVLHEICELAGVAPRIRVDESLVRSADPAWVAGDASKLKRTVGWEPRIPIRQTIADMISTRLP